MTRPPFPQILTRFLLESKAVLIVANHAGWHYIASLAAALSHAENTGNHYHIDNFEARRPDVKCLIIEYNEPPVLPGARATSPSPGGVLAFSILGATMESTEPELPPWNPYISVRHLPEFNDVVIEANHDGWELLAGLAQKLSVAGWQGYHHHVDDLVASTFGGNVAQLILEYREPPATSE